MSGKERKREWWTLLCSLFTPHEERTTADIRPDPASSSDQPCDLDLPQPKLPPPLPNVLLSVDFSRILSGQLKGPPSFLAIWGKGWGGGGRWTYPPPPKLSINTFHWRLHGLAKSSFSAVSHLLLFHSLCMWPTVNISICLDYIRFLYIHFHQLCHNQSYRSSV